MSNYLPISELEKVLGALLIAAFIVTLIVSELLPLSPGYWGAIAIVFVRGLVIFSACCEALIWVFFRRKELELRLKSRGRGHGLWLFYPLLVIFSVVGLFVGVGFVFNSLLATTLQPVTTFGMHEIELVRFSRGSALFGPDKHYKMIETNRSDFVKSYSIPSGYATSKKDILIQGKSYSFTYVPYVDLVIDIEGG